jgi:hypothetical protein
MSLGLGVLRAVSDIFIYMQKIKIEQHSITGGMWFAAWLFTIGILDLQFWQGVLAVILWPYYLGHALTAFL